MFRHLKLIDGSSDKFWEIQTDTNSHTVTYGRNGTSGQSKTKSFENEEACLKDAEKLVHEKIKKGYSDDGLSGLVAAKKETFTSKNKSTTTRNTIDKQAVSEELVTLIKQENIEGLIPFLEKYLKGNSEFIKKEIRKGKRYWLSWVDLSKERSDAKQQWGARATQKQKRVLVLSALAVFSLSDTTGWDELMQVLDSPKDPDVKRILDWAKPDWLSDYVAQQFAKNEWLDMDYHHIRLLEEWGYFVFNPEVYSRSLAIYRGWHGGKDTARDLYIQQLIDDKICYERDIPLLFEYETNVHASYYEYNYQTSVSVLLWDKIFDKLLSEGKMDRSFFFERSLEIQTKNWNINLKSFFRKGIQRVNPSEEELLNLQTNIFSLLHNEQNAVVNYAIDMLKPLMMHDKFDLAEFITWTEPVMVRNDLKGGIKTLLIQFDRVLKTKPTYTSSITNLIADVFMVPDLGLQERAGKLLAKYADQKDEDLKDKISMYADQILGNIKDSLQDFISSEGFTEDEMLAELGISKEPYVYAPVPLPKLRDEDRITYPSDWNDILFQIGKVVANDDPIEMEILIYSWLNYQDQFPLDYRQQVEPFIKQYKSKYQEYSWFNIFSDVFLNAYYTPDKIWRSKKSWYLNFQSYHIFEELLAQFQEHFRDKITLPLLSTPTHTSTYIDPLELINRIVAYEKRGVSINPYDFAIAISRMPAENLEVALPALKNIKNTDLIDILNFCFGVDKNIHIKKENWFQSLIPIVGDRSLWKGVWAVAARTFYPEERFEALNTAEFKDTAFAFEPYRPEYTLGPKYGKTYNYQTKKQEDYIVGIALGIPVPTGHNCPKNFLYGRDLVQGKSGHYYYGTVGDIKYLRSLTPQNTEALALLLTMRFNYFSESSKAVNGFLGLMLEESFAFNPAANLLFVSSMFSKEKSTRILTGEVLIQSIEENRLPVSQLGSIISKLISTHYGPLARLMEALEMVKDVSFKHNDALFNLLIGAFQNIELTDRMPTNFKKMLELFYDLKVKLNKELSLVIIQKLESWNTFSSLKSIIGKLTK